jgi:glycosyltransferase involved in cell wall biosynthesis
VASSLRYLLLAQLLSQRDAGYDVVAVSAPGPDVAVLEAHGIRHRALAGSTRGFDLGADVRALRSFVSIVRQERPDVVHTHNPKPGVYGRVAARVLGVPLVVNTVHGLYAAPDDGLARRAVVYGLEAVAARFSHVELVQNAEDAELMRRTPLAPSAKVRLLGNGVDLDRFRPSSDAARRSARRELGIGDDAFAVVAVGRLVAEKGFGELFAANRAMRVPHVTCVIGPDDLDKADALTPAEVDRARRDGVRFLGHRADVERLLPAFDTFALPSHREGFPRAAMEAAASGLPVVATDVRGCRQVVDSEVTGLLVPRGDSTALALALDRLGADPELRRTFGRAGRAKAEAEFDEDAVVRRVLDAYAPLGAPCRRPVAA